MTDSERFVKKRHPAAWLNFDACCGTFKVYADRAAFIALSESCASSGAAWANAERAIKERIEQNAR